jgi:hypothetical protein
VPSYHIAAVQLEYLRGQGSINVKKAYIKTYCKFANFTNDEFANTEGLLC